jgi:prepilin-type processing-associated H-X9-DG protein
MIPAHFGRGMEFTHYLSGGNLNFTTGWSAEKNLLNDPYVYISNGDKYASKVQKEVISSAGGDSNGYCEPYIRIKNSITTATFAISLSYCTIAGFTLSASPETIPLAFTRGLKANGTWHSKYGLYGDKGGYIVYCDGHVTWYDGSKPVKFLRCDQSGYSTDVRDAVSSDALISCGHAMCDDIKDTDNSLMIVYHQVNK